MNRLTMTIFSAGVVCLTACAASPSAKMTLYIRDAETAEPLGKVKVKTQFRPDKDKRLVTETKQTDTNGVCIVEGPIDYICISSGLEKEGYYWQTAQLNFTKRNRVLNRWEPWNPTIEVKLRKKKNQMPMVYKWIRREDIPVWKEPVGFDLELGDWIAPHGRGKVSDFIFNIVPETKPKEGIRYTLSFSSPLDGIQEFMPPKEIQSSFIFPYEAPTNNYVSPLSKYRLLKYPELKDYPANNLKNDRDINYIFRVRTKTDEDGNIVSANYGRIKGEVAMSLEGRLYIQYWYNPDPNSRSLESLEKPY